MFEVSSLSDTEFVLLVGHYNYLLSGAKDEVDPRLLDKGYSPEALEALKQAARQKHRPITSCGLRFTKHLSHYKHPLMGFVLAAFDNYERGVLPYPGSLADQPAKVIEMFQAIKAIRNEHERREQERIERENKKRVRR